MARQAEEDWRYPLRYPKVERTPKNKRQMFQPFSRLRCQSVGGARDLLLRSLAILGAKDVIISSNVPVNGHGKLSGNSKEPDDPGVAVYFRLGKSEMEMCCDRWLELKDNLQVLSIQVEVLIYQREIAESVSIQDSCIPHQHGKHESSRQQKSQKKTQTYNRNSRTQGQSKSQRQAVSTSWAGILGVKPGDPIEIIRQAYHRLARRYHTDRGGNEEMMKRVNNAWDEAKAAKQG